MDYKAEVEHLQNSVIAMGGILEEVVHACRGAPPHDCSWSTHDAADLARKAVALADAALANIPQDAPYEAQQALERAVRDWQAVKLETEQQAAELNALRDNPHALDHA